jgi:hypothetical protein
MGDEMGLRFGFVTYIAHKRGLLGYLKRDKVFTMTRRALVEQGLSPHTGPGAEVFQQDDVSFQITPLIDHTLLVAETLT